MRAPSSLLGRIVSASCRFWYNHWTFELATADAPKLTAERLDEQIAYHVEQAREYSTMAAELPAQVAAFNAAAAYLKPIKRSIDTAMLYAGI